MGNILRPFHLGENFAIAYFVVGMYVNIYWSQKKLFIEHLQAVKVAAQ